MHYDYNGKMRAAISRSHIYIIILLAVLLYIRFTHVIHIARFSLCKIYMDSGNIYKKKYTTKSIRELPALLFSIYRIISI